MINQTLVFKCFKIILQQDIFRPVDYINNFLIKLYEDRLKQREEHLITLHFTVFLKFF